MLLANYFNVLFRYRVCFPDEGKTGINLQMPDKMLEVKAVLG